MLKNQLFKLRATGNDLRLRVHLCQSIVQNQNAAEVVEQSNKQLRVLQANFNLFNGLF
jgi:hypothetical protein